MSDKVSRLDYCQYLRAAHAFAPALPQHVELND
jgi:hypothetical protein